MDAAHFSMVIISFQVARANPFIGIWSLEAADQLTLQAVQSVIFVSSNQLAL